MRLINCIESIKVQSSIETITVDELIEDIKNPSRLQKKLINNFRTSKDKEDKLLIQPYCYNSIFESSKSNATLTGCFFIDIDKVNDINEVKSKLFQLPYIKCVYTSCSTNGVHAIAYYNVGELTVSNFKSIYNTFSEQVYNDTNLVLDIATSNHNRLVFGSYDEEAMVKSESDVKPLDIKKETKLHIFEQTVEVKDSKTSSDYVVDFSKRYSYDNIDRKMVTENGVFKKENYKCLNVFRAGKLIRIKEGNRHQRMCEYALYLLSWKDRTNDEVLGTLFQLNKDICFPELSSKEVISIFKSSLKKETELDTTDNGRVKYSADSRIYKTKKERISASRQARKEDNDVDILGSYDCLLSIKENAEIIGVTVRRLKEVLERNGVEVVDTNEEYKVVKEYKNKYSNLSIREASKLMNIDKSVLTRCLKSEEPNVTVNGGEENEYMYYSEWINTDMCKETYKYYQSQGMKITFSEFQFNLLNFKKKFDILVEDETVADVTLNGLFEETFKKYWN